MFATQHLRGHTAGFQLEAISGIDIALWDIAGKALDVPVCQASWRGSFDGRFRSTRRACRESNLAHAEATRAAICEQAAGLVAVGHRSIKVKLGFGVEDDRHHAAGNLESGWAGCRSLGRRQRSVRSRARARRRENDGRRRGHLARRAVDAGRSAWIHAAGGSARHPGRARGVLVQSLD